jgi:hypothetical protein
VAAGAVRRRVRGAAKKGVAALRAELEAVYGENAAWRAGNVLVVLVGFAEDALAALPYDAVQVGRERLSWVRCHPTDTFLDVLSVAEAAAERVYVPPPNHFPIAVPTQLRVDIHPYTPNVAHRALWYGEFAWERLEAEVRSMAAPGQTIGFFSTQTTGECGELCGEAFKDVEAVYEDGAKRAAFVLNGHTVPKNFSWSVLGRPEEKGGSKAGEAETASPEFDVYVLDTARVSTGGGEEGKGLGEMPPAAFPGIAVLAMRSSSEGAVQRLRSQIVSAIATGAYGVAEPGLYPSGAKASPVLTDIIARTFVASLLAVHGAEARQLLDDLIKYGIDPAKALDDRDYVDLVQHLNLLLYKQDRARVALSEANRAAAAVHYASSARFDVHAARAKFGLNSRGEPNTEAGFRDPTVRCHFSRVKRSALLLTSRTREWRGWLAAIASYLLGLLASRALLARYPLDKRRLKRH